MNVSENAKRELAQAQRALAAAEAELTTGTEAGRARYAVALHEHDRAVHLTQRFAREGWLQEPERAAI